jgi:large subunit ribosomal protein L17
MRHRVYGRKFSRDSEHRRAMLRNLAAGLFEHGEIETTLPKAKAVRPFVERIITIARKGGLHARREVTARLADRRIHAWVDDPAVPDSRKDNPYFELPEPSAIRRNRYGELRQAPRLVQHVMNAIAPMYRERQGGYTRIVRLGRRRLGDGADLVLLQLVGKEDGPQVGGRVSGRRRAADGRTAFAARLRRAAAGSSGPAQAEAEDSPAAGEPPA